jgi:hypothetical protein
MYNILNVEAHKDLFVCHLNAVIITIRNNT